MNPCQSFKDLIMKHFDGELDIHRKKDLEKHLDDCCHCSETIHQLRALRSEIRNLTPVECSEDFHVLLRERIRRDLARKRKETRSTVFITRRLIPAIGAVAVVALMSVWLLDDDPSALRPAGNLTELNQPGSPSGESFDGPVEYVIDEYPSRLSVSRDDRAENARDTDRDSLRQTRPAEDVRGRMTPVSF